MNLISAKCPNCGADINVDEDSKVVTCEYCNKKIIVENTNMKTPIIIDQPKLQDKNKRLSKYLIIFTIILIIAYIIAIKLCIDNSNSLGLISFVILGLNYISFIKQSDFRPRAFLFSNIVGFVFFAVALVFSLYVHNLVPEYVNTWESENIKLIIEKDEATVEFKNIDEKETSKYSTNLVNGQTIIKISKYTFVYSQKDKKMCYSQDNECIEELKMIKTKD